MPIDITPEDVNIDIPLVKAKRKYVKKSMMLLRSNNDYIDHGYYAKKLEESKENNRKLLEKYGASPQQKPPAQ